jgi:hypothetical protein
MKSPLYTLGSSRTSRAQSWAPVRLAVGFLTLALCLTAAKTAPVPGTWFKIRTNGVPQSPMALAVGASGDLWMTSESPNELGAWRWPDGGQLLHITGDSRENDLGRSSNLTEKPELAGKDITFAIDDSAGNVWYALQNGGVKVQKQDGTWVTFDTTQPEVRQLADNMMSRIRFGPGGVTLLIGPLGAYVVDASFQITQRRTGIFWNNDFVNDALIDTLGRFWVCTNRGPYRGANINAYEHVSTLYSGSNVPSNEVPVTRIEQDTGGNVWLLSNSYSAEGIFCLTAADAWEKYTTATVPEIGSVDSNDLMPVPNGDVWFGLRYGNGIGRFRRGSGWTRTTMATMSIDSSIVTSLAYTSGKLWFSSGYNPSVPGNGTGVHKVTLDGSGDFLSHEGFTYTSTSTTLPSNRCRAVAADKSGNVWFGGYDRPSISRHKADGTWEMFNDTAGPFTMNFGVAAMGVDSANIVYFYSYNSTPFAYNANTDTWVTLPAPGTGSFGYPYGLYVDENDEKWFNNSDGVMRLSADNTTWTYYSTSGPGTGLPSQYVDYGVRLDRYGNTWFGTRGGLAMLHPDNTWTNFTTGSSGYGYPSDGTPYKAILDDNGEIWSQGGLRFDYDTLTWSTPVDQSPWANRNLPFVNGFVFRGTDTSKARGVILNMTGNAAANFDEDLLTLDTHGNVYLGQWMFSSDLGVVGYEQPADALAITPGSRNHTGQASAGNVITVTATRAWTATASDPWIDITTGNTGAGDGTVTYALTTNANAGATARSGSISVMSLDGLTQTFTVNQSGVPLPPAGELLSNPEFNTAAGANWLSAGGVDRGVMFATPGEADMHVTDFIGTLLWQDFNVPNAGGMAFRVGAILHAGSYPPGKSVAVYLNYLDGSGAPQRLLVLEPENRDIESSPFSTYLENQVTLPPDAQQLTGLSIDRLGPGEFTAESLTLTTLGYAIPVSSLAQLEAIGLSPAYPLSGNYVMTDDIDASSTAFTPFAPIGGTALTPFPFSGSFDGQDHAIIGLTISRPAMDAVGLFRSIAGRGIVRNLALEGGSVSGQNDVGAFVGMNDNSTVLRCSSTANVSALGDGGGIVGGNHSGHIQECYAGGTVTGQDAGGAPAGACGGVTGLNMGMVRDSIAVGPVNALNHYSAGGLAGTNLAQGQILRCYSTGVVSGTGTTHLGGLVGDSMDVDFVQASFWDTDTSTQAGSSGGTGRTTAQMFQGATFTSAGWDFTGVWDILEASDYPYLRSLLIQLLPPLMIGQDPIDQNGALGGSIQFTVQTTGGLAPLTYQWQQDQMDLTEGGKFTGTDTDTLTVSSLALADSGKKFRVLVTDDTMNTVTSQEATLTVIPGPDATTNAPSYSAATRATLAGEVNSKGLPTTVTFLWGTSAAALTNTSPGLPSPITPAGPTAVSAEITNLTPNKTYYYRVQAQSAAGTTQGGVLSFKTLTAIPPIVKTLAASNVSYTSADVSGTVNARQGDAVVSFEYGPSTAYGFTAPGNPAMVFGNFAMPISGTLSGLQPHTKYYYRIRAESDRGSANGAALTFITANHPVDAWDDTFALLPSGKRTLNVLANDGDLDGDSLSVYSFTQPPAAVGKVAKVGSDLVFTPSASFTGGTFKYTATDGFGSKTTATVTLTLATANLNSMAVMPLVANGGQHSVDIHTTAAWNVVEGLSWVTASPTSGIGDATVSLTVSPNPSKTARSGTVVIGGQPHLITQAGVLSPDISVPGLIPDGIVSGDYTLAIPTLNPPVVYTISGLPTGTKIDQATGVISGKPTRAGDFDVVVRARNASGTDGPITFSIHIEDMPDVAKGSFTALVDRDAGLNDTMGGLLNLTSSSTGALSGTLKLDNATLRLKGQLDVPLVGDSTAQLTIARRGLPSVLVDLTITDTAGDGILSGSVMLVAPGALPVPLNGARHPWSKAITATDFAGYYTAAIQQPSVDPLLPQGTGYFTIKALTTGRATWAGKLADGTAFTGSSYFWQDDGLPMYLSLYKGKGSLMGTATGFEPVAPSPLRIVGGSLSWLKQPQTTRTYAAGLEFPALPISGSEYIPPDKGLIVLGLTDPGTGGTNATIAFTGGNLESADYFADLMQDFRITTAHKGIFAGLTTGNPAGVRLTSLNPATGLFTGSCVLKDPNPVKLESRTVPYYGVILQAQEYGEGFALVGELSAPPIPASRMPQQSGRVTLTPKP